jgi:hypothetical protein
MTALITVGDDPGQDVYVNSSWWFEFLERHLEPVEGELRDTLDVYVSVVGVDFPSMAPDVRPVVARWLVEAIDADIEASLLAGQSLEHMANLRAKVLALR